MAPTDVAVRSVETEHRAFRLPRQLYEPIRDVASGFEEGDSGLRSCAGNDREVAAGVRVTDGMSGQSKSGNQIASVDQHASADNAHRSAVDMLSGLHPFDVGDSRLFEVSCLLDSEIHMHALERWYDRCANSRRHLAIAQARRSLAALRDECVGFEHTNYVHFAVMHIVYGPKDPFVIGLPREFVDRMNGDSEHPLAGLARYTDTVEAWRREMVTADARMMTAIDESRGVNFGSERYRHADRRITSGDALRDILDEHIGRSEHESTDDYKSRASRGRSERDAVVTMIKIDASRMLADASKAYLEAWRAA